MRVRPTVGGVTTDSQARAVPRSRVRSAEAGARATGARALEEGWEEFGDALFTYCLSVLCDQEEAVAAVRELRQLSARHRRRLRRPEELRAWLYALARHVCLVRMEAEPIRALTRRPLGRHSAEHARLELLAWPEAAGVAPAQREALELVGRHGLDTAELAAVLDLRADQAGVLLAQAVCELERTAAALAVLAAADCPELSVLGRGRGAVLSAALRGELVNHVDECPTCRGTAERAAAAGPWPGTFRAPGALALVEAPREARKASAGDRFFASLGLGVGVGAGAATGAAGAGAPPDRRELRFDRRGFPIHRSAAAERAGMLRQRTVAGSVIALVVAAPVVALWATHQGANLPEDPVSSVRVDPAAVAADGPSAATSASTGAAVGSSALPQARQASLSVAVADSALPAPPGFPAVVSPQGGGPLAPPPVRLEVSAGELGGRTVVTLVNSGGTPVAWQASTVATWLRLSRDSGTLQPGERLTLVITVDRSALPEGPWTAFVWITPSGSVVTLHGPGAGPSGGGRRGMPPPTAGSSAGPPPGGAPTPAPPTSPAGPPRTTPPASSASPSSAPPSDPPTASASPSATASPSASTSPSASASGTASPSPSG
ncbi:DNA-directed RNA polymerase specialized sigma24 family protein [Streptacidiphilus sp. EB103A]